MANKKSKFLTILRKMCEDKRKYRDAVKNGKTIEEMERDGLKFTNILK